jgi:hypothetical protein
VLGFAKNPKHARDNRLDRARQILGKPRRMMTCPYGLPPSKAFGLLSPKKAF